MRNSQPPNWIFIVVIPALFLSLVVLTIRGMTGLWDWARRRRLARLAAVEGVSFEACMAPIVVPEMAGVPPRSLRVPNNFLYGSRRGVEVFACDYRAGEGRSMVCRSMIAIRADLHHTDELDLKRWELLPMNGWTFLIPRYTARPFSRRKIVVTWDLLTGAMKGSDTTEASRDPMQD